MMPLAVCSNSGMGVQDCWLANLKALVDRESQGSQNKRLGIRAVALAASLSEEYVYQLYTQQPKADGSARVVGPKAAKALARAFADGRPPDWFDRPPEARAYADAQAAATPSVVREPAGTYLPTSAADARLSPRALQLARLYDAASEERKGRFEAAMTLVGLKVPAPDDIIGAPQSAPAARPPEGFEVMEGGSAPARHGRGKGVKR